MQANFEREPFLRVAADNAERACTFAGTDFALRDARASLRRGRPVFLCFNRQDAVSVSEYLRDESPLLARRAAQVAVA